MKTLIKSYKHTDFGDLYLGGFVTDLLFLVGGLYYNTQLPLAERTAAKTKFIFFELKSYSISSADEIFSENRSSLLLDTRNMND